ncbi:hypothetical protein [Streptomyces clavifer]|uniref:hypothetical protein n=1 Tax=Streptomyces clavifer TaxID=68188 RepID=UPI00364746CA
MAKQYPKKLKERAVRLLLETRGRYKYESAAIRDPEGSAQLKALKKEVAELKRANEILKLLRLSSQPSWTGHTRS